MSFFPWPQYTDSVFVCLVNFKDFFANGVGGLAPTGSTPAHSKVHAKCEECEIWRFRMWAYQDTPISKPTVAYLALISNQGTSTLLELTTALAVPESADKIMTPLSDDFFGLINATVTLLSYCVLPL
jgi:hypothetical protein